LLLVDSPPASTLSAQINIVEHQTAAESTNWFNNSSSAQIPFSESSGDDGLAQEWGNSVLAVRTQNFYSNTYTSYH